MNPSEIPIRDIKPLLPIPDLSIYFFTMLLAAAVILFLAIVVYIWRWRQKYKKQDPRILWLKKLDRMDYSDSKKAAYLMTRYGKLLAEDKRQQEIMEQLLPRLERYKYKKDVPPLDEETIRFMKLFIEMSKDAL